LLTTAHAAFAEAGVDTAPDYHLPLPGDWRARPDSVETVARRQEAAPLSGLAVTLERLRYEWTPRTRLPEPTGRLALAAEPDDELFFDLLRRVLTRTRTPTPVTGPRASEPTRRPAGT
jgi:hypothetical protein